MKKVFTILCLLCFTLQTQAQFVFQFDFTGYTTDGVAPPIGASSGNATLTQSGLANFYSDNCTGAAFASNGWSTNDYIEIQTSTVGFVGPFSFNFDYRMSSIDLGNFAIQVSTNGTTFTNLATLNAVNPTTNCNAFATQTLSTAYI